MHSINTLAFWLNGTVIPHISLVTSRILWHCDNPPSSELKFVLFSLQHSIYQGSISHETYCKKVVNLPGVKISSGVLNSRITDSFKGINGMLTMLMDLKEHFNVKLFSTLPFIWRKTIMEKLGLHNLFAEENIIENNISGKTNLTKQMLEIIEPHINKSSTLIIDDDPLRCMYFVKLGYYVNIFVNTKKLHRDLNLWGIIS